VPGRACPGVPLRGGAAFVLAAVLAVGCAPLPADEVIAVRTARVYPAASPTPPDPADANWRTVALPDLWRLWRRRLTREAWYETTIDLPAPPRELWAVYLPRAIMNVAVYVNGELVGSGGPFGEPLTRIWNHPQLFTVPSGLWRAGVNRVDVRLVFNTSAPGMLTPFWIGPDRLLRPAHEWRWFGQVTLLQTVSLVTLGMALLLTGIYLRRDRQGVVRWMAPGIALWAVSGADAWVQHPPLPTRVWEWMQIAALYGFVACLTVAFHRALEVHRPRVERVLLAIAAAFTLGFVVVPPLHAYTLVILWGVVIVALGGYLLRLMGRVVRRGTGIMPAWTLFLTGVIGVAFGLHDVTSVLVGEPITGVLLAPYVPSIGMLLGGAAVLSQLAHALTESETLNAELEQRVHDKAGELERNYDRLRELERERAVTRERERIMQDMHDGMGGQLVSTLALVESGRATPDSVAEALRAALDDLRLVIDSLDPLEDDILAVLGVLRARLEPRLTRHGLRFDWQVTDLPAVSGFGPERALQALRVIQEAITNVIKHAGAKTILIRTGVAEGPGAHAGVFVEVHDDGCGVEATPRPGRGLANMRRRAAALGGTLSVASNGAGTTVRLWLPTGAPA
jgi:signal transduction histidine kinase